MRLRRFRKGISGALMVLIMVGALLSVTGCATDEPKQPISAPPEQKVKPASP
jgi:hypothetical protein